MQIPLILCGSLRPFAVKKIAVVTNYDFSHTSGKMRFAKRAKARCSLTYRSRLERRGIRAAVNRRTPGASRRCLMAGLRGSVWRAVLKHRSHLRCLALVGWK
jgi:hypothetical protein